MHFANAAAHAHTRLWSRGLTFTLHGYLALWPNLATTAAANLVRLEYAPLVTTFSACLVQLLPIALILWSGPGLWSVAWKKLVAVTVILLAPLSAESWLNTINSQFYFALAAFLLLIENAPPEQHGRWPRRGILAMAGLTGPPSCFFTPLFVARAIGEKSRERAVQAAILGAASIIQISLLITRSDHALSRERIGFAPFDLIPIVWNQSLALTLAGLERANDCFQLLQVLRASRRAGYVVPHHAFLVLVTGAELAIFWLLSRRVSVINRVSFLGAYGLLIVLSLVGTLEPKSELVAPGWAQRYFFAPNAILLLWVLAAIDWNTHELTSALWVVVLAHALYLAGGTYRTVIFADPRWPNWREEVRAWRTDPSYPLRVWPLGPEWIVRIAPTKS